MNVSQTRPFCKNCKRVLLRKKMIYATYLLNKREREVMKNPSKTKTRQSNFELLRIIAMLIIVAHHFAVHGIQHVLDGDMAYVTWAKGRAVNKIFTCLLVPGGKIGVGIFFMITGYFLISKHSFSLKKVVLQSAFYGVINSIIYVCLLYFGYIPMPANKTSSVLVPIILAVFNPATGGTWWFISAYFLLILLLPFINKFLNKFNQKGYLIFLIVCWILWYSIGSLGAPYFNIAIGVFFYGVGGFIRLFGKKAKRRKRFFFLLIFIIVWVIDAYCVYKNAYYLMGDINTRTNLIILLYNQLQTSFCWPICAICVFKILESIDIGTNQIINQVAGTTFGIYLIHEFGLFKSFIWNNLLKVDVLYLNYLFPLYAIIIVFFVFIVCSVIEKIRQILFEPTILRVATSVINKFNDKYTKH